MPPRQTRPIHWPKRWLVTDERMGEELWHALARLPRGSGVVFRHYATDKRKREKLGRSVARICRRRNLLLAVARDANLARRLGASLVHNPTTSPGLMPHSRSVHDEADATLGKTGGAALVYVSPMFATRSHPNAATLGMEVAWHLARTSGCPAIALGGMSEARLAEVRAAGFAGYAGIDCWIRT